jgi:hypothetical protein
MERTAAACMEGTTAKYGTAGLPLPNGERVGVRGIESLDSL